MKIYKENKHLSIKFHIKLNMNAPKGKKGLLNVQNGNGSNFNHCIA